MLSPSTPSNPFCEYPSPVTVIGLDPAHRAGAVYLPLAEVTLEFVVPDVFLGDDTFLAADMRSPLISCECSASAHGLSFPRWL